MQEELKRIFKFLLIVFFTVIGIKFFIYLLPFILICLLIYWLFIKVKDKVNKKKNGSNNYKPSSKKKSVIEAEIVCEKLEQE